MLQRSSETKLRARSIQGCCRRVSHVRYERTGQGIQRKEQKRGAGYWLWKPYIILYTMVNIAKPDDYIIYTDTDKENEKPLFVSNNRIKKLLDTQNIVISPMGYVEGHWTKRDAFVLMGMDSDPKVKSSGQMNAAVVIVKNTFKAQRFIGEWLTYIQDPRASTDEENTFGQ